MKKSIVALAVTSAAFASVTAYAEGTAGDQSAAVNDKNVSFYGNIQYGYTTSSDNQKGLFDNGSSLGFKGDSKVTDTTRAFFNVKFSAYSLDLSQKYDSSGNSKSGFTVDNAEVGLTGDFGKVQVGTWDGIYNDSIQDGMDLSEKGYTYKTTAGVSPEGDTIAYFSPNMNGFQVLLSAQANGSTKGVNTNTQNTLSTMGVVKYSTDMYSVAVGYDANKNNISNPGKATTGIKVSFMPTQSLLLAAKYEKQKDVLSSSGVSASYSYGMGSIYAGALKTKPQSASSYNESYVGVNYSVNSSMYVYVETGSKNSVTTSTVGTVYSF